MPLSQETTLCPLILFGLGTKLVMFSCSHEIFFFPQVVFKFRRVHDNAVEHDRGYLFHCNILFFLIVILMAKKLRLKEYDCHYYCQYWFYFETSYPLWGKWDSFLSLTTSSPVLAHYQFLFFQLARH